MSNSIDPNKTSHLDLHYLQKYLFWSAGMKRSGSIYLVVDNNIQMHTRQWKQNLTVTDEAWLNRLLKGIMCCSFCEWFTMRLNTYYKIQ